MEAVVRRKILGLVGLGIRGRLAVIGVQQVRDAAKRGKLKLALVAGDASRNSLNKVIPLLAAKKVMVIDDLASADLATISGRVSVSTIGIIDSGLAKGIRSVLERDFEQASR